MKIILENEKELITRFFDKNGFIHILIGNLLDRDSNWIFNQVSMFFNDMIQKYKINIEKLAKIEKHEILIEMNKFLNYIEKEIKLKVKFEKPNFNFIDNWLRLDYIGLSYKSVGVISLLFEQFTF